MTRLLLAALLAGWVLFFIAQSLAGPFDGFVPAHVKDDGARDLWAVVIAPLAADLWHTPEGARRAAVPFGTLLVVVPALAALAGWRMVRRTGVATGATTGVAIHHRRVLSVVVVVSALLALFSLTYLSNDLYLYRAQGLVMSRAHLNPYAHAPAEVIPADDLGNVPWEDKRSGYGPLALWMFRLGSGTGPGVAPGFWTLKVLMSLPVLALLMMVMMRRGVPKGSGDANHTALVAWLGLNPLIILEVHQNAHLEGWIGVLLLGAMLAAGGRASWRGAVLSGVLVGLATALKSSALVVVGATAGCLAGGTTNGFRDRRGWGLTLAHLGTFAAVLAILYAPFWLGTATFQGIGAVATKTLRSVHFVLLQLGLNESSVNELGFAGVLAAIGTGGWIAWRHGALAEAMMAAVGIHAILGRNFFQPWYVVPMLFFALPALGGGRGDPRSGRAFMLSAGTIPLLLVWSASSIAGGYAPFYWNTSMSPGWQMFSLAVCLLPPLAVILPGRWPGRMSRSATGG